MADGQDWHMLGPLVEWARDRAASVVTAHIVMTGQHATPQFQKLLVVSEMQIGSVITGVSYLP